MALATARAKATRIFLKVNSAKKSDITTFEKQEEWYLDWIAESQRDNTMDEYGQIIGLIGYVERNRHKKHLLLILQPVQRAVD